MDDDCDDGPLLYSAAWELQQHEGDGKRARLLRILVEKKGTYGPLGGTNIISTACFSCTATGQKYHTRWPGRLMKGSQWPIDVNKGNIAMLCQYVGEFYPVNADEREGGPFGNAEYGFHCVTNADQFGERYWKTGGSGSREFNVSALEEDDVVNGAVQWEVQLLNATQLNKLYNFPSDTEIKQRLAEEEQLLEDAAESYEAHPNKVVRQLMCVDKDGKVEQCKNKDGKMVPECYRIEVAVLPRSILAARAASYAAAKSGPNTSSTGGALSKAACTRLASLTPAQLQLMSEEVAYYYATCRS